MANPAHGISALTRKLREAFWRLYRKMKALRRSLELKAYELYKFIVDLFSNLYDFIYAFIPHLMIWTPVVIAIIFELFVRSIAFGVSIVVVSLFFLYAYFVSDDASSDELPKLNWRKRKIANAVIVIGGMTIYLGTAFISAGLFYGLTLILVEGCAIWLIHHWGFMDEPPELEGQAPDADITQPDGEAFPDLEV